MQFAEITEDPFINNTNNYFLVMEISQISNPQPTGNGTSVVTNGELFDPNGYGLGQWNRVVAYSFEATGNLSNEAYAFSWLFQRHWMLIPPKFKINQFYSMWGFWLTPDEVKQFIFGRLSLKGGD